MVSESWYNSEKKIAMLTCLSCPLFPPPPLLSPPLYPSLLSFPLSLSLLPFLPTTSITVPVFGFEFSAYTFSESVGMGIVAVTLDAESGQLSENVVFTFSTLDGSAEGKLKCHMFCHLSVYSFRLLAPGDYTTVTSIEYTFVPGVNRIEIPVTISNDGDFEGPESFNATIATTHLGAVISRQMTTIEIVDDDCMSTKM